ncbi:gustatory receptor [Homalodisca vitripennis]|nr:gustatory receptor [Homalodisca vitripennis]
MHVLSKRVLFFCQVFVGFPLEYKSESAAISTLTFSAKVFFWGLTVTLLQIAFLSFQLYAFFIRRTSLLPPGLSSTTTLLTLILTTVSTMLTEIVVFNIHARKYSKFLDICNTLENLDKRLQVEASEFCKKTKYTSGSLIVVITVTLVLLQITRFYETLYTMKDKTYSFTLKLTEFSYLTVAFYRQIGVLLHFQKVTQCIAKGFKIINSRIWQEAISQISRQSMGDHDPSHVTTSRISRKSMGDHDRSHVTTSRISRQSMGYHDPPHVTTSRISRQSMGYHDPPHVTTSRISRQSMRDHDSSHVTTSRISRQSMGYHDPPHSMRDHDSSHVTTSRISRQSMGYHDPPHVTTSRISRQSMGYHDPPHVTTSRISRQSMGDHDPPHVTTSQISRQSMRDHEPHHVTISQDGSLSNNINSLINAYHLLCDVVHQANIFYSDLLMASILFMFIHITVTLYFFYLSLTLGHVIHITKIGIRIFSICYYLLLIVSASCDVTQAAEETALVIGKILNKDLKPELKKQLNSWLLQLADKPVEFSPRGFFVVNGHMLTSLAATVMTNLVILIQFRSLLDKDNITS